MRKNYTRFGNRILYGWFPGENSPLFSHNIFIEGSIVLTNEDMSIESLELSPGWEFQTKSMWIGKIWPRIYREVVPESFEISDKVEIPAGDYSFYGLRADFMTTPGKRFNTMINIDAGTFYDGWRASIGLIPTWVPVSDLEFSGFYQINRLEFPDRHQKLTAHILRIKALATLSVKFSASAFVQTNTAAHVTIVNIRFRYNPKEGTDFYMVYNEEINGNRSRKDPFLPFRNNRTLLFKFNYTFNL